jgi:DNA polymerase-1
MNLPFLQQAEQELPPPSPGMTAWQIPRELPTRLPQWLSFDSECTGVNPFKDRPVGFSIAYRTDALHSMYLPFGHASGNLDPEMVMRWAKAELRGKDLVFANAKYDIAICRRVGLDLESIGVRPHDVAFKDALLDDERAGGHGLNEMGLRYCGEGKSEFPGVGLHRLPSWKVGPYAEQDARLTLLVDEATQPAITEQGLQRVLDLEDSLIYAVCHLESTGSRIDVDKLHRWRREVQQEYESCMWQIFRLIGERITPTSSNSLVSLLRKCGIESTLRPAEKEGESPYYLLAVNGTQVRAECTSGEHISLTDEAIERLAAYHPAIQLSLRARRLQSLKSKFLDKFADGLDGDVLRSQYHQLKSTDDYGTVSGRFSSSGGGEKNSGYSFNAQQTIKPKAQKTDGTGQWIVRELFIPDDGMEYFCGDASQIEYRLFGHFANADHIINAYRDDPTTDFHAKVTELVRPFAPTLSAKYGTSLRDVVMKNVNFARLYNAGDDKIAEMIGESLEGTKAFLKVYDGVFPESKTISRRFTEQAKERGYVTTLLGRRGRFSKGKGARGIHSATNRVVQGSAADLMKKKLLRIYNERHTLGISALRQTIHDELDGDILPDPVYQERLRECFNEQEMELKIPIMWEVGIGENWLEAK